MTTDALAGLDVLLEARPEAPGCGMTRSLFIPPGAVLAAARRMDEAGYHLEDLSGLDCTEGILVNYHFDHYTRPERIVMRALAAHENGRLPSIASVFGGAEWHERELSDLFGVTFEGNPNPAPLLLPAGGMPPPLRKDPENRRALHELMDPGTILFQAPGFDLFRAVDPSTGASAQGEGDQG